MNAAGIDALESAARNARHYFEQARRRVEETALAAEHAQRDLDATQAQLDGLEAALAEAKGTNA